MQRFGKKLRSLRTYHEMTLKNLALALGYKAHGHISEIESGKKVPTANFAVAVANLFDVSVDSLLKDSLEISLPFRPQDEGPIAMSIPFADRPPTTYEVERFRLIFSTYQDGTGMLASSDHGRTLPGWRDFERSIALAFDGIASENKDIFDIRLPDPRRSGVYYGISCKMRRELSSVDRRGRVTIELSNSARKFWDHLMTKGIDQANYKQRAADVGRALIELVSKWHHDASVDRDGNVDLSKSCYLTLSWDNNGSYQLHQFPLSLPGPGQLTWMFPTYKREATPYVGNHLNGDDTSGSVFQWYGESGGQLKYYPLVSDATWESDRFKLEDLPSNQEHGVLHKVERYFPKQWAAVPRAEQSQK